MKFYQLELGQRFEFEGEVYVRTKPLIALSEENGRQRFIRRSATVKVLPAHPELPDEQDDESIHDDALEQDAVREAFDAFYTGCLICLEDLVDENDGGQLEALRSDLKDARARFLETLSL